MQGLQSAFRNAEQGTVTDGFTGYKIIVQQL